MQRHPKAGPYVAAERCLTWHAPRMPTGPKHLRFDDDGGEAPCRCTYGEDHGDLDEFANGPKYCCGLMYENGEDTCRSCGEPLT